MIFIILSDSKKLIKKISIFNKNIKEIKLKKLTRKSLQFKRKNIV